MTTFGTLKARLDSHANRTDADYTAQRDFFVNGGLRWIQRKLLRDVGIDAAWQDADEFTAGASSILAPGDWRPSADVKLFYLDGSTRKEIRRIPKAWMREPFFDAESGEEIDYRDPTVRGTPAHFAVVGRTIEIRPAADKTYTLELTGLGYLPDLSADGDTNLLTIEAEDLCLYAGLRQCWLFFEDDGKFKFWEDRAKEAALDWGGDRIDFEAGDRPLVMEAPGGA